MLGIIQAKLWTALELIVPRMVGTELRMAGVGDYLMVTTS